MTKKEKRENSSDDKISAMKQLFTEQRELWQRKIRKYSKWIKIPDKLTLLQIVIRNEIMVVSEEKAKLLEALISLTKMIRKRKAEALIDAKTNSDVKFTNKDELFVIINAAINDLLERESLIEMQISFLEETCSNFKDIGWAVKNYLDLTKIGVE